MVYHTVHHTFSVVPFYKLPELHREVEQEPGYTLPGESCFALHWRHLKALYKRETEISICDAHTGEMRQPGRLPE